MKFVDLLVKNLNYLPKSYYLELKHDTIQQKKN